MQIPEGTHVCLSLFWLVRFESHSQWVLKQFVSANHLGHTLQYPLSLQYLKYQEFVIVPLRNKHKGVKREDTKIHIHKVNMLATVAQENLRTIGTKGHVCQMQTWAILCRMFSSIQKNWVIENNQAQQKNISYVYLHKNSYLTDSKPPNHLEERIILRNKTKRNILLINR